MASPGEKKGQCPGSCGRLMASFDNIILNILGVERSVLSMIRVLKIKHVKFVTVLLRHKRICWLHPPTTSERKEKKSGILVSPDEVTVIASVEETKTWNLLFNLLFTILLLLQVMQVVHLLRLNNLNIYQINGQSNLLILRLCRQEEMSFPHLKPQLNQCHHTPLSLTLRSLLPLPSSPVWWMSRQRLRIKIKTKA